MSTTLLKAMNQPDARTANGAATNDSTGNGLVDFFFQAGASRNMEETTIIDMFKRAFTQNVDKAFRLLFWARDVRGGAGERRIFQIIMRQVRLTNVWDRLYVFIPEYGSWKDYFTICVPPSDMELDFVLERLNAGDGLAAKWYPRKGIWFNLGMKRMDCSAKEFRQLLVKNSKTVEQQMCNNKWDYIKYSGVPSVAMSRYANAFRRHSPTKFQAYLDAVREGQNKINAGAVFPHDVLRNHDAETAAVQWEALPNYMEGNKERILPICDVSGSMGQLIGTNGPTALEVCIGLGLYIAERNEGIFKDQVLTFSAKPKLHQIEGDTIFDKRASLQSADWGYNTDFVKTFKVLLERSIKHNVPQEQMPTMILCLSDMEFDAATRTRRGEEVDNTPFEVVEQLYKQHGYTMPKLVFWNLMGRVGNFPVTENEEHVGLVSGYSPAILKPLLSSGRVTPTHLMNAAIMTERYDPIHNALYTWLGGQA